jgi:hypothetical protein
MAGTMQQIEAMQPMEVGQNEPISLVESQGAPERYFGEGLSGYGNWNEVPMTGQQTTESLPQEDATPEQRILAPEQPTSSILPPPDTAPMRDESLDRFQETTIGKAGAERGWDPRAMYAALAGFAGEFGNLRGQATSSTAQPYYKQMMGQEEKERENDRKMQEMALRFAPKKEKPIDALKQEYQRAQIDALKNKSTVDVELNDANSPRSQAARFVLEKYMQSQGIPKFKADERVTAADVYKWLPALQYSVGQIYQGQRTDTAANQAEERQNALIAAQDKRNQDAIAAAERRQQASIAAQERMQKANLAAQSQRQGTALAAKAGAGGVVPREEVVQVPGWQKVENVPVEKTELQQFRKRTAAVPRVIAKIGQLKQMIQKYGPYENEYSSAGQQMMSLANDIKLDLKGPEFKALGVLAGPDMAILEALIPDTTSIKNIAKYGRDVAASLDSLASRLEQDLDASGASIGFSRQQQQQPAVGPRGKPLWKP